MAKNLAYAECRIMKFHYRNSSNRKGPLDWISTANALTDALTDAAQPTKLDHLSGEKTRYLLDLNR